MGKESAMAARRDAVLHRLGGPPGPYAVVSVVMALLWFPIRLVLDRDEPIAEIIVASGLSGAIWALMWLILGWGQQRRRRADGSMGEPAPLTASQRRVRARRGAIVGMGVGLPFFGSLIVYSLETGRSPGYPATFAVVLLIMTAVATWNRRAASR
jgi:hypothetical protein